jgi:hypothetical protein
MGTMDSVLTFIETKNPTIPLTRISFQEMSSSFRLSFCIIPWPRDNPPISPISLCDKSKALNRVNGIQRGSCLCVPFKERFFLILSEKRIIS